MALWLIFTIILGIGIALVITGLVLLYGYDKLLGLLPIIIGGIMGNIGFWSLVVVGVIKIWQWMN